ncbi:hypothetical protein LCGC14_1330290, partial [marine sediment metagenome]
MPNPFLVKDTIAAGIATSTTWPDQSDNSIDGTVTSATLNTLGDATSEYNPFWIFDGVNDKVVTGTDANLGYKDTTPFSLEALFRTTDTGNNKTIIGLWQSASTTGDDIINLQHNNGTLFFYIIEDWSTQYILVITDNTYNDGLWHHVVVTFDGTSLNTGIEIYVDGALAGISRLGAGVVTGFTTTNTLGIGNNAKWQAATFYEGNIALGRLWNRELSQAEVTIQYNGGDFWKVQPPTVDQWGSQTTIITNAVNWNAATGDTPPTGWTDVNDPPDTDFNVVGNVITCENEDGNGASFLRLRQEITGITIGTKYKIIAAGLGGVGTWLLRIGPTAGSGTYVNQGAGATLDTEITATTTSIFVDLQTGLNTSDTITCAFIVITRHGGVAEYRLVHTNSYSPYQFMKSRFLPVNEPEYPNQITGVAGGGQTKTASLGDDEQLFPINIMRVTETSKTNLRGFLQDSTVNYALNDFVFVDEDSVENTVRYLKKGGRSVPIDFPMTRGGLFNINMALRKV